MQSLATNLLPDERIIFRTKKHFIIFLPSVLLTAACLLFLVHSNPFIIKVAILPGIAALISWANDFLEYMTAEFAVTTKRILMKEGFFFKHTVELRLAAIANVSTTQSLLGQYLNYGSINIQPFGGTPDMFSYIASAIEFQKQLQLQLDNIDKYKQIIHQ